MFTMLQNKEQGAFGSTLNLKMINLLNLMILFLHYYGLRKKNRQFPLNIEH